MITIGDVSASTTKVPRSIEVVFASQNRVPRPIVALFAAAEKVGPGNRIPIATVDEALKGLSVENRFLIKSELRQRGAIA
jgi:hypothetical protein